MGVTVSTAPTPNSRVSVQMVHDADLPAVAFTVLDDDGVAVDLTSSALRLNVFDKYGSNPEAVFATYTQADGDIAISGASSNVATVTYDETDFTTFGLFAYELWQTTAGSERRICSGVWEVDRSVASGGAPNIVNATACLPTSGLTAILLLEFDVKLDAFCASSTTNYALRIGTQGFASAYAYSAGGRFVAVHFTSSLIYGESANTYLYAATPAEIVNSVDSTAASAITTTTLDAVTSE